jgi:methylated-DNA-[protein]-cysteine S-methyltransferase
MIFESEVLDVKRIHDTYLKTKIGILKIVCDGSNLVSLDVVSELDKMYEHTAEDCNVCQTVKQQLVEYFDGQRIRFDLPLAFNGSKLQIAVWDYLSTIPYGSTVSYSQVANAVNCKSVRAVGTIIGKNPIPIIIPCHRVIRKDGTFGQFSLVGPELKKYLLEFEKANVKD